MIKISEARHKHDSKTNFLYKNIRFIETIDGPLTTIEVNEPFAEYAAESADGETWEIYSPECKKIDTIHAFNDDAVCDALLRHAILKTESRKICRESRKIDLSKDDLNWIKGLHWVSDWHDFTVTSVNPANKTCKITEEWIAEDCGKDCINTETYLIKTDDKYGSLMFISKRYPQYGKFYANSALNYRDLVPAEIDELAFLDDDPKFVDTLDWDPSEDDDNDYDDEYTPSATRGDYSPSNPWDAPGMSIHDFI